MELKEGGELVEGIYEARGGEAEKITYIHLVTDLAGFWGEEKGVGGEQRALAL